MKYPILAGLIAVLGASAADAGLQRWTLGYYDANGNPASYDKAARTEVWMADEQGNEVALGCGDAGPTIALTIKLDGNGKDPGSFIEPGWRVSVPGTDLWLGPIGRMEFDGTSYVADAPMEIVEAMRKGTTVHVLEHITHSELKWRLNGSERYFPELDCLGES